jgi:hypothetical protein
MNSALSVLIVDDNVKMRSMIAEIKIAKQNNLLFVPICLLQSTPFRFYRRRKIDNQIKQFIPSFNLQIIGGLK